MAYKNLEEKLKAAGNAVDMMRNSQIGAYVYPVVAPEFTNWRDEQRAWRETCVLFDQSHHMVNLFVEGPDALKLLSYLGDQLVQELHRRQGQAVRAVSYDGHVIGDGILFYLAENQLVFVGRNPAANWIQFHAKTGGYDVKIDYDDRSPSRPMGKPVIRKCYRYQIQGPNAAGGHQEAERRHVRRTSSSSTWATSRSPAARCARCVTAWPARRAWRSGARTRRATRSAPRSSRPARISASCQVGARAYATNTLESGWIPSPVPAVYTGDKMKAYREWLPGTSYEANAGARRQLRVEATSRTTT